MFIRYNYLVILLYYTSLLTFIILVLQSVCQYNLMITLVYYIVWMLYNIKCCVDMYAYFDILLFC